MAHDTTDKTQFSALLGPVFQRLNDAGYTPSRMGVGDDLVVEQGRSDLWGVPFPPYRSFSEECIDHIHRASAQRAATMGDSVMKQAEDLVGAWEYVSQVPKTLWQAFTRDGGHIGYGQFSEHYTYLSGDQPGVIFPVVAVAVGETSQNMKGINLVSHELYHHIDLASGSPSHSTSMLFQSLFELDRNLNPGGVADHIIAQTRQLHPDYYPDLCKPYSDVTCNEHFELRQKEEYFVGVAEYCSNPNNPKQDSLLSHYMERIVGLDLAIQTQFPNVVIHDLRQTDTIHRQREALIEAINSPQNQQRQSVLVDGSLPQLSRYRAAMQGTENDVTRGRYEREYGNIANKITAGMKEVINRVTQEVVQNADITYDVSSFAKSTAQGRF